MKQQEGRIGRPVRVVSIALKPRSLQEIQPLVDRESGNGANLIILPETCSGAGPG